MKYYENFKNATNEEEVKNNGLIPALNEIGNAVHSFELKNIDDYCSLTIGKEKPISILIETKFNANLAYFKDRNKVLAQAIKYNKELLSNKDNIKKSDVIMLVDKDCIVPIDASLIKKYSLGNYSFNSLKACDMYKDENLMHDLNADKSLENIPVFFTDRNTEEELSSCLLNIAKNISYKFNVLVSNIQAVYNQYGDFILDSKNIKTSNDKVGIFIGLLSDKTNYYQHPNAKNILKTPQGDIPIDAKKYAYFTANVDLESIKPSQEDDIVAIRDIIIEETERRSKGQFYTPSCWAEYANKMCEKYFGEDYRHDTTWDPCCGTKALTRLHDDWDDLYCSTLEKTEIDNSSRFNKASTSFQFDFLDEPLEDLVAKSNGLVTALKENKTINFVMNPPYATACNMKDDYKHKSSVNERGNLFKAQAKEAGFDFSCENLYQQFLEKVCYLVKHYKITNYRLELFSPAKILINPKFKNFRKAFFKLFNYEYGCQFNAGEFAGTKSTWNIALTLWSAGENKTKNGFKMDDMINDKNGISILETKNVYNADDKLELNKWMRNKTPRLVYRSAPSFSSGLVNKSTASSASGLLPKSIGYIFCLSKSGEYNTGIMSTGFSASHGNSITADNFDSACAFFSARNLVNDEQTMLVAPNEKHADYQQFVNDSVVYSIFNGKNNATSLRNIAYTPDKKTAILDDSPTVKYDGNGFWNINNAWYPLSAVETNKLADDNYLKQTYDEAKTASDSFVYNWLQGKTLSTQAQKVLDIGCELIRKSFQFRQKYDDENPNHQIMNWDCGWYQLKDLAKEYMKDDFTNFQKEYKILSEEMSKNVYELGFIIGD